MIYPTIYKTWKVSARVARDLYWLDDGGIYFLIYVPVLSSSIDVKHHRIPWPRIRIKVHDEDDLFPPVNEATKTPFIGRAALEKLENIRIQLNPETCLNTFCLSLREICWCQ